MKNKKPSARSAGDQTKKPQVPVGAHNRGTGRPPANPIRVRTKRLDQIDGDKIALAYWLLAKQIVANGSDQMVTEEEARRVAREIDEPDAPAGAAKRQPGDAS